MWSDSQTVLAKQINIFTVVSGWVFWKFTHHLLFWKDWHFNQSWSIELSSTIFLSTMFLRKLQLMDPF